MSSNTVRETMSSNTIRETALRELATDVLTAVARTFRAEMFRSCLTCAYFEGARSATDDQFKPPRCAKHCVNPPAFVIANGCVDYVDNDAVPF